MGTRLHQLVAVTTGKKDRTQSAVTEVNKKLQKQELFQGIKRTYRATDVSDGQRAESLPDEVKNVQFKAVELLDSAVEAWSELWDLVATQDESNTHARADIVVDDQIIVNSVPVTTLMYLEKQLNDVHTLCSNIPVLDSGERWDFDSASDLMATDVSISNRTKKMPRAHVLYQATAEHPAQVNEFHEDVKVGEWSTKKFSGAMTQKAKNDILSRIRKLIDAVKMAREKANEIEVKEKEVAGSLFGYIMGE